MYESSIIALLDQVRVFFAWTDYLKSQVPAGKQVLFINMDETSIPYAFGEQRGNIAKSSRRLGVAAVGKKSELRGAVTHVAFITHDTTVQPKLPQIIIGNTRRFTPDLLSVMADRKPNNVVLIRAKSAWNTTLHMMRIIGLLGAALQEFPQFQPVLVLDTASCHTTPRLVRCAGANNIWISFVPAKLTYLLQPLDTHVFASYKLRLRRLYREAKLDGHGVVSVIKWLELLFDMCTKFLCSGKWRKAFERTGMLGTRPQNLSSELQAICADVVVTTGAASLPSKEDLQLMMPRGTMVPYVDLWWKPAGRGRRIVLVWGNARQRARA